MKQGANREQGCTLDTAESQPIEFNSTMSPHAALTPCSGSLLRLTFLDQMSCRACPSALHQPRNGFLASRHWISNKRVIFESRHSAQKADRQNLYSKHTRLDSG